MRGGVEALRTGVSPGDMTAAIAAQQLDGLADVTITNPQEDDVLTRSGSSWVNAPASGGGGALTNLIPNGDFETNITGWSAASGATLAHNVDDWAWSGTGCLKVTTPGSGPSEGVSLSASLPAIAGQVYLAQAVVATEDTHVVALRITFDNAGTRIIGTAQLSEVSRDCITGVFVVPPDCTTVGFQLRTSNTAAGDFYTDELRLVLLGTLA